MAHCSSCGSYIPEGQGNSCSMCYGDPYFGKDGYYLAELEKEYLRELERKQQEEEQKPIENE